jgi:hypothetical protein
LNQVKRPLISIVGGILIPLVFGLSSLFMMDVIYEQWGITWFDWLAQILLYLVAWPMALIGLLLPSSDSADPNAPLIRRTLYLTALLCTVMTYSLLTYGSLWWYERRKRLP